MTTPLSPPDAPIGVAAESVSAARPGDAARAGAIQLAAQGLRLVVSVATGMTLARLLTPTDFGVYAMVATLLALVDTARGFGLGPALVHDAEWSASRAVTVAKAALIGSLALSALVVLMAAPLSWIYSEPRVSGVALAVSLGVFFAGVPVVWEARLVRQLNFWPIARAETIALIVSVLVALFIAVRGGDYWALVAQYVTYTLSRAVLLRLGSQWGTVQVAAAAQRAQQPSEKAQRWREVRPLLAFGRQYTLAQTITFAGRSADRVVVGVLAGPAVLGLYENANRWSMFAFGQVLDPLYNVFLATLNRARRSGADLGAAVSRVFMPPMSAVVPALAYLALETPAIVRVLLGDQWDGAVPYLRILCGAAAANSVLKFTRIVHVVTGSTARQLRFAVFRTLIMLAAVLTGAQWSAMGIAWSVLLAAWSLAVCSLWYSTVETAIRPWDIVRAFARPSGAALVAAGLLRVMAPALESDAGAPAMLLRAAMFGVLYAAAWLALPGGTGAAAQLMRLLRDVRGGAAAR